MLAFALLPLLVAPPLDSAPLRSTLLGNSEWASAQGTRATFRVGELTREALVYAPSKPSAHPPLVLVFHGHGGTGRALARQQKVHTLWPEAVVVYPQGLPTPGMTDPDGKKPGWQRVPGDQKDRDLKFVDAMLTRMAKEFRYDAKRVYAMGHSNGGRFTYVVWAARGDKFAAYGPSGSPATGLMLRMKPAPAFLIAGEKDPLVPFATQKRTADALATLLKVGPWEAGEGYARYAKGSGGLELGTYFHPGGHEYPEAGVRWAVDFLKRHTR